MIILLLLLVPVRYHLKARFEKKVKARLSVGWLLKLIQLKITAINLQALLRLKLLWFSLYKCHLGNWGEEEEDTSPDRKEEKQTQALKSDNQNISSKDKDKIKDKKSTAPAAFAEKKKQDFDPLFEELAKIEAEEAKKDADDGKDDAEESPEAFYRKIMIFLEDEKNQESLALCVRQLKKLGKHLQPTYFQIEGEIGLKNPADTALLLARIYRLYPLYGKTIQIRGNFQEPVTDVFLEIKGRLRLGTLIWIALRLWINKNFRSWLKKDKSRRDDNTNTEEISGAAA